MSTEFHRNILSYLESYAGQCGPIKKRQLDQISPRRRRSRSLCNPSISHLVIDRPELLSDVVESPLDRRIPPPRSADVSPESNRFSVEHGCSCNRQSSRKRHRAEGGGGTDGNRTLPVASSSRFNDFVAKILNPRRAGKTCCSEKRPGTSLTTETGNDVTVRRRRKQKCPRLCAEVIAADNIYNGRRTYLQVIVCHNDSM